MTREEAKEFIAQSVKSDVDIAKVADAIKAIEQESVIDKIRAEIENDWQLKKYPSSPFSCGLRRAIEILDKYKAEQEKT